MLDGRVLGAFQVEYKPFGNPPLKRKSVFLRESSSPVSLRPTPFSPWRSNTCCLSCADSRICKPKWPPVGRAATTVGALAFCHGLLKFEPQNARMRTSAKLTGAVLGQESGSAKKRALPEREWGRVSFGVALSCSAGNGGESASGGAKGDGGESALELGVVVVYFLFWGARGESASGGAKGNGGESALELGVVVVYFLFSGAVCQEGILSGRNFVRKEFCQARKGFCQEAGSARKHCCQEAGSARKEFCQGRFLSGSGLCQVFCQEAGSARKGESALELGGGVVSFFPGGRGPVSFRGCEGGMI